MTWRWVDPFFARRIQLAIFVIAVLFGCDYLFTPSGSSTALTSIERALLPLWLWGAVIIAAGVAGLIIEGWVLREEHPLVKSARRWDWGWVSNIAHATLIAIFTVLAGSSVLDIVQRGLDGGGWYGWRTALMWSGYVYANAQFVRRLGGIL